MINQRSIRACHVGCSCSCRWHGGALCIERGHAAGKSTAASRASLCQRYNTCSMLRTLMQVLSCMSLTIHYITSMNFYLSVLLCYVWIPPYTTLFQLCFLSLSYFFNYALKFALFLISLFL